MKLHNPNLPDVVIDRNPRQAKVLAAAGWEPVEGSSLEPPRSGRGSGADAWRSFLGNAAPELELPDDASRDDLIAMWDTHTS